MPSPPTGTVRTAGKWIPAPDQARGRLSAGMTMRGCRPDPDRREVPARTPGHPGKRGPPVYSPRRQTSRAARMDASSQVSKRRRAVGRLSWKLIWYGSLDTTWWS